MSKVLLSEPEPPPPPVHLAAERATSLSEELAVLDRPLDYEIEYYDEVPPRRWPKRLAFMMGLLAAAVAGYIFVAPRLPKLQSSPPPLVIGAALAAPPAAPPAAQPVATAPPDLPPPAPGESPPVAVEPAPPAEAGKPTHSSRHHSRRHATSRR